MKQFESVVINPKDGKSLTHVAIFASDIDKAEETIVAFINNQETRKGESLTFANRDNVSLVANLDELPEDEEVYSHQWGMDILDLYVRDYVWESV